MKDTEVTAHPEVLLQWAADLDGSIGIDAHDLGRVFERVFEIETPPLRELEVFCACARGSSRYVRLGSSPPTWWQLAPRLTGISAHPARLD